MEPPTVPVRQDDIIKLKKEMAMFSDMFLHMRTVVADLKQTIKIQMQNIRLSTDSGMSSETLPIRRAAENGADSNETPEEAERVDAAQTLLTLKVSVPIRPVQPVRYGIIRHNPNRVPRKTIKLEPKSSPTTALQPIEADVNEIPTGESYLHKKKRAAKMLGQCSKHEPCTNMVSIGSGKTLVPKDAYSKIKWGSYTIATRKLLISVFPRKVLATHSLTGKASPAFANKPAKMCLDQRKVADIIMTVSEKCKVKESLVRNAITTKCADENKMLRMKEKRNKPC